LRCAAKGAVVPIGTEWVGLLQIAYFNEIPRLDLLQCSGRRPGNGG